MEYDQMTYETWDTRSLVWYCVSGLESQFIPVTKSSQQRREEKTVSVDLHHKNPFQR